jgi:hypothetical protein
LVVLVVLVVLQVLHLLTAVLAEHLWLSIPVVTLETVALVALVEATAIPRQTAAMAVATAIPRQTAVVLEIQGLEVAALVVQEALEAMAAMAVLVLLRSMETVSITVLRQSVPCFATLGLMLQSTSTSDSVV